MLTDKHNRGMESFCVIDFPLNKELLGLPLKASIKFSLGIMTGFAHSLGEAMLFINLLRISIIPPMVP